MGEEERGRDKEGEEFHLPRIKDLCQRCVKVLCVTLIAVLTPPMLPGKGCYRGVVRDRVTGRATEKARQ